MTRDRKPAGMGSLTPKQLLILNGVNTNLISGSLHNVLTNFLILRCYCTTSFYFVQLTMDDGSSEKSFDKMIIAATKPWYYYYYYCYYCYRYHYYCCCYCYYFFFFFFNYSFDSLQKPCCHFRLNNKPDLNATVR